MYILLIFSSTGSKIRAGGGVQRRIKFGHEYDDIISLENLLEAWKEFVRGKCSRMDVQEFEKDLMTSIISLHTDLVSKTYIHSAYHAFNISDPKPRNIHKATVRDRLLHHAIYRILYPYFNTRFIYDSYSCRLDKGTHRGMDRFRSFFYKVSKNNTRTCWILKCDIKKFFASIDHEILLKIVTLHIKDEDTQLLLKRVVESFESTGPGKGLPLGNLTSQLLVNVYMNEFDQYMKHELKTRYYIRYADDFVILSEDRKYLENLLSAIETFLYDKLKLFLHPDKVSIQTMNSGVDFLGWVHFPDHRVLRTATKKRMFKNIKRKEGSENVINSYIGLLKHGNAEKLRGEVMNRML